jgi:hypothetical protein
MDHESFIDLRFPSRGIDRAQGYGMQREGTTQEGANVLVSEPLTGRSRGGMRPGLSKYVDDQTSDSMVQELNFVIVQSAQGLPTTVDLGWPTFVYDPSSPGPPTSWGTIPLLDPDGDPLGTPGNPVTGTTQQTRNPIDPSTGSPRKVRDKGSGIQPNKNTLQYDPSVVVTFLFAYEYGIEFSGGTLNGIERTFAGSGCFPLEAAPTSGFVFGSGQELQTQIDTALAEYSARGYTWSAITQTKDLVFGPFGAC